MARKQSRCNRVEHVIEIGSLLESILFTLHSNYCYDPRWKSYNYIQYYRLLAYYESLNFISTKISLYTGFWFFACFSSNDQKVESFLDLVFRILKGPSLLLLLLLSRTQILLSSIIFFRDQHMLGSIAFHKQRKIPFLGSPIHRSPIHQHGEWDPLLLLLYIFVPCVLITFLFYTSTTVGSRGHGDFLARLNFWCRIRRIRVGIEGFLGVSSSSKIPHLNIFIRTTNKKMIP